MEQQDPLLHRADGVRLAYAVHGSGPPIVRAATWLTHLELDWESPVWRHWLDGLGDGHTVVRYDERGCGLSDRDVGELSVETWVGDLETVVDAAGLERFALLGVSQGAAIAVAYAARHPERVTDLVLYGGYARGRSCAARSTREQEEALVVGDPRRLDERRPGVPPRVQHAVPARTARRSRWRGTTSCCGARPRPTTAVRLFEARGAHRRASTRRRG